MSLKYRDEIFEGYNIRISEEDNNTWYCAKDILDCLGYKNVSANIVNIFNFIPDKWIHNKRFVVNLKDGRQQYREMLAISREGLHLFLERSTMPKARDFQEWLAGPVLTKNILMEVA